MSTGETLTPRGVIPGIGDRGLPQATERSDLDGTTAPAIGAAVATATVLPLYAEEISVARRNVEQRVQVHVHTVTREHAVDEILTHERVEIERVPIGLPVDAIPPDREEGDTTVIPVVEEVVVIHRQLVLREEIRMRRVRVTEHHRETVSLRVQEAAVERSSPDPARAAVTPGPATSPHPIKDQAS
jgi:stress response protein YsnF